MASREPGVMLVGICVDKDAQNGRRLVADSRTPGLHLFSDTPGSKNLLKAIVVSSANQIYICDAAGKIVDIQGGTGLMQKLATLKQ